MVLDDDDDGMRLFVYVHHVVIYATMTYVNKSSVLPISDYYPTLF